MGNSQLRNGTPKKRNSSSLAVARPQTKQAQKPTASTAYEGSSSACSGSELEQGGLPLIFLTEQVFTPSSESSYGPPRRVPFENSKLIIQKLPQERGGYVGFKKSLCENTYSLNEEDDCIFLKRNNFQEPFSFVFQREPAAHRAYDLIAKEIKEQISRYPFYSSTFWISTDLLNADSFFWAERLKYVESIHPSKQRGKEIEKDKEREQPKSSPPSALSSGRSMKSADESVQGAFSQESSLAQEEAICLPQNTAREHPESKNDRRKSTYYAKGSMDEGATAIQAFSEAEMRFFEDMVKFACSEVAKVKVRIIKKDAGRMALRLELSGYALQGDSLDARESRREALRIQLSPNVRRTTSTPLLESERSKLDSKIKSTNPEAVQFSSTFLLVEEKEEKEESLRTLQFQGELQDEKHSKFLQKCKSTREGEPLEITDNPANGRLVGSVNPKKQTRKPQERHSRLRRPSVASFSPDALGRDKL